MLSTRSGRASTPYPDLTRGGWGVLLDPKAPSSLVNTPEAVSIFELAGVRPDDEHLERGLEYLRSKVALHPRPDGSHPEARGLKPRYLAHGLMGLTAIARPIEEASHSRAIATCVQALDRFVLRDEHDSLIAGKGWSEHPQIQTVSVLSTSVAARALDRVPNGTPAAEQARELASSARRRLRHLARGNQHHRWWPTRSNVSDAADDDAASCALTGLAVLALAEGGATSQSYARAGVRWLLDNVERWHQARESEESVLDASWIHVTRPLRSHLRSLRRTLVWPAEVRVAPPRTTLRGSAGPSRCVLCRPVRSGHR